MKKGFLFIVLIISSFSILNAQWTYTGGPYAARILSFASAGNKLYAGTVGGDGLFVSEDFGVTWNPSGFNRTLGIFPITHMACDDGHIFFSGDRGVMVSTDGGINWSVCNLGLTSKNIQTLLLDGTNLYAGTEGGGLFLSTDFGVSWKSINNGLTDKNIYSIYKDGATLFAGGDYDMFRSDDMGKNWIRVKYCRHTQSVFRKGDKLFANALFGVKVSTDNGNNWIDLKKGPPFYSFLSLTMFEGNLYACSNNGVLLSTDDGNSWRKSESGLMDQKPRTLFSFGDYLYAATEIGVFRLHANDTKWSLINSGFANVYIDNLQLSGNNLFAKTVFGIFSYNGEEKGWILIEPSRSWGTDGLPSNKKYGSINSFFAGEKDFFIGTDDGIYTSTDFGVNWHPLNHTLDNFTVYCLGYDGANLYYEPAGENELFILDNDKNQAKITPDLNGSYKHFLALCGTDIYWVSNEVFVSKDKGKSWTSIRNNLPEGEIKALVKKGSDIFVGLDGKGVYRSTDNGLTWSSANSNLPVKRVNALLVCNNSLFAGTEKGVYFTTDNGTTWNPTDPAFTKNISSLITYDKFIFAGTLGYGIWSIPISNF